MKRFSSRIATATATLATGMTAVGTGAWAQEVLPDNLEVIGQPVDGAMGFQPAATNIAQDTQALDNLLLYIIVAIALFVTALLAWCIVRFNRRANPEPATFSHHTPIEIAWTIVPVVILVFIGAFSLPVLFKQQVIPEGTW